jgi:hypothetical protein
LRRTHQTGGLQSSRMPASLHSAGCDQLRPSFPVSLHL